jgi:hypothetical protein
VRHPHQWVCIPTQEGKEREVTGVFFACYTANNPLKDRTSGQEIFFTSISLIFV